VPPFSKEFEQELESLRWNIRLLGPPIVFEHLEYSHVHLILALTVANFPDRYSIEHRRKVANDALRAWQQVSNTMRADLRGDEETLQQFEKVLSRRSNRAESMTERMGNSDYDQAKSLVADLKRQVKRTNEESTQPPAP
jgi:predicted  nucleic acid-binding Zn-ribbon protein